MTGEQAVIRFEIEPSKTSKETLDNIVEMVEAAYPAGAMPAHKCDREQSQHWARKFEEQARRVKELEVELAAANDRAAAADGLVDDRASLQARITELEADLKRATCEGECESCGSEGVRLYAATQNDNGLVAWICGECR